ncbi:MAG: energy transducer TonB, partial [Muribaculaceae bacterium]|nr:energy transducer TonB [Muribaculaceae bacterium]
HSKLKKRITMMYQEKSGAGRKFKALALVPMLSLALGVVAVPSVRAAVSTISNSEVAVSKGSENIATNKNGVQVFKVKNLNNNSGKTTITIQGEGLGDNITVSGGKFTTNGKTYEATGLQCNMTGGVAKIVATFPFVDSFDKSSMSLTVNGEEIPFNLENFLSNAATTTVQPEVLPQYPGGESAMMQAVISKVSFPDPGREWKEGASGLALVQFTVMPDGTMSNFERVLSSGYGDLDQIAIDAVKNGLTEKWTPGTVGGKPVAVSYNIPIRFKAKGNAK